jgi:DNA-directed RNA polymerase subunit RPC12/RpoP
LIDSLHLWSKTKQAPVDTDGKKTKNSSVAPLSSSSSSTGNGDESFDRSTAAPVPVWPAKKGINVNNTPTKARAPKKGTAVNSQTLPAPVVAAVSTPVVAANETKKGGSAPTTNGDTTTDVNDEVKATSPATPIKAPKAEAASTTSTPGNGTPGTASKVCSVCKKTVLKKDFALNQYKKATGAKCKECSGSNSLTPSR